MKKILSILFLSVSVFVSGAAAQKERKISEIQGDKNFSPFVGQQVKVKGIVTARIRNGFFIQTPDDQTDNNPETSEGIFIFTNTEPNADAAIGNLVTVTGMILEFRPKPDPQSLPITQISWKRGTDVISVESKDNPLPKPIVLMPEDFKPNSIDQLEKYEGMRVTANELTVVAPTDGSVDEKTGESRTNGTFYAVLKGFPRPFREIGYSRYDFLTMPEKEREKLKKDVPKMVLFDHNPERLRIESLAQLGSQPIDVTVSAEIKNVTGVINYAWRAYSILVDADNRPTVSGNRQAMPLPPPGERQFSVVATNIERLFDDEDDPAVREPIITSEGFERRLKKLSLAIRNFMQTPDIIAVIEAENLPVLKRLAERLNKDSEAAGKPNPKYEAFLVEGNDIGGIDSGFLVKTARVEVLETMQFGKEEKFKNPVSKNDVFLNDRPPFLLRAAVKEPNSDKSLELTVIVNHLKSFRGYTDEKDGPFVQMKKKLQAEFLANAVSARLKSNPKERILLVGDFNFFQFNDGIMDVIGAIKGTPAPKDSVITHIPDLLDPDLTNLVDVINPSQKYSFSFDGNAQVLDHFLVNDNLKKHVIGFGYSRLNVDFPEIFRNDPNRPERFADHDAAVGYFSFDERPAAN